MLRNLNMSSDHALEKFAESVYLEDTTGENFIENVIHTQNLPSILAKLSPRDRILEFGYGEGTITAPLVERGYSVEIVEGSEKLCEAARARFGDKVVVHHSLFEEFKPAQPYDAALALHVLEHVDEPRAAIAAMTSCLTPEGRIVGVVPNAQSLHRQLAVMIGLQSKPDDLSPRDHAVGHQRVYSLDQFASDFEACGLEIEERFGYFVKIVPNSMMREWSPDLLRALTDISGELPPHLLANIGVVARRRRQA
jgi:SAM-dependent methyltransferase